MISFLASGAPSAYRDRAVLRKWLERVAIDHGTRIDQLAYVLMTDRGLLTYNKRYLGHDEYTDVITFPVESNNGVAGDILMSYDRIRANAKTYGVSVQYELRRVMVHGLLHLCGHDDRTKKQKQLMRSLEDRYLSAY